MRGNQPDVFVKLHRKKGKDGRATENGAFLFINGQTLCKALQQAGIDCLEQNLKAKASACKDGKRAKIIIQILKA